MEENKDLQKTDKKDIVMVINYSSFPIAGKDNGRAFTIIDLLLEKGYDVELITSDFSHTYKRPKEISKEELESVDFKYTMLHEPAYPKNVCIKRFVAHSKLASNISKYLKKRKKPDLIFTVTTSTAVAYKTTKYAKKNNIPLVIDVQDLWPEAFKMVIKPQKLADIIFLREQQKANYIYKNADGIIGVSQEYVDRAMKVNRKNPPCASVYLGTSLLKFDSYFDKAENIRPKDEFWVVYIGTLGTSYNIKVIIDAFKKLKDMGYTQIKFKILGSGPLMEEFENYAKETDVQAEFLGRVAYSEMVQYLASCNLAVNPIIDSSAASIINKVADYAMAGLPVINTLRSKEYIKLLSDYNAGYTCANDDSEQIAEHIKYLYENPEVCKEMGQNSRKSGEELFDRNKTYPEIIKIIENQLND